MYSEINVIRKRSSLVKQIHVLPTGKFEVYVSGLGE